MPRNHNTGPSTLRNRNRVTNKTRLKVITESIDADPIVLDEDEEKARVVSTAGVDAEDANEHHLQAVLSAAATRHQASSRSTRAASEKDKAVPAAYIPTPDSTGVVDNYTELYAPGKWKDPATYVKSSDTVEEAISFSLANGFIYYMDERDKEWLDKNNEEARGEGTSAQGAMSGASTRSGRSTKAKGKDPEIVQPVAMSEDEFELVMAIFEKITHEKTPFLHHGLGQGTPFPPFTDYQDTFANTLPESMFAVFAKPAWIPQPPHLPRIARVVYSHWRERRLERAGHPIIPSVNLDETDTRNESYICFRRREIKAVRKTRAQQATYSDKMLRLQAELATAEELAKGVLQREHLKRETAVQARAVWEKRFTFADLKRKFPALGTKDDEELFHDKERIPKKPRIETRTIKFRAPGELASPVFHAEPQIKPKERQAQIQSQIEQEMAARKEKDHHWEDAIDNPYQPTSAPYASKLWRAVAAMRNAPSSSASTTPDQPLRAVRAGRLRYGRGGRLHLDRRTITSYPWGALDFLSDEDKNDVEAQDRARRLAERWRYDEDDALPVGSEGPDEKDRILVDDFQPKYLAHHMSLLTDQDRQSLITDATITITASDGRQQTHTPFRVVAPERRIATPSTRAGSSHTVAPGQPMSALHSSSSLTTSGTPVSMSSPFKKMPSSSVPHLRISSLGNMRPPGLPSIPNIQSAAMSVSLSSPHNTPPLHTGQASSIHDANGLTTVSGEQNGKPSASVNSDNHLQPLNHQAQADGQSVPPSASPMRPKAQVQPQAITIPNVSNGYHIGSTNPYQSAISAPYMHSGNRSLIMQQMQSLKSAFASMAPTPDPSLQLRTPASYGDQNRSGYPPMAAARQWNQHQRPPSVNSTEAIGVDSIATPVMSPPLPTRTPSANGMHNHLSRVQSVNHSIVQPQGRASPANAHIARLTTPMSPSPHLLSASLAAVQPQSSPSRSPQPPMATPSPSMQPRHVLGTGY